MKSDLSHFPLIFYYFLAYGIDMYIKTKISNQISSLEDWTSEVSIQCNRKGGLNIMR